MRIAAGGHGELLADLIRAIDAIAARCDELSGRVEKLEVVADDLARVLGEEVTHLRAAVERMETQGSGFTTP
jgi:tetrahydromethanopterin S-methyltransferase subunit B